MNSKEINHAHGLIVALGRKAVLLRQQADDLDAAKDGRSQMAAGLRVRADDCDQHASELRAATDSLIWLDR